MKDKPWYEELFEDYAEKYDKEVFTQGTLGECDFIEKEANYNKHLQILDVGCGTGRHAIELTRRGYSVTGIDLSGSQLQRAREKAKQLGLQIDFLQHDARDLPFQNQFDLAIMLCGGGFPLMETDEMNFEILQNVSRALKPKAKFIFTTLNGLYALFHSLQEFHSKGVVEGNASYNARHFDLLTFRDHSLVKVVDDKGVEKELQCNERYYVPPEITWLLKEAGFTKIDILGATLGAFSREDKLTIDHFEMLVIAGR